METVRPPGLVMTRVNWLWPFLMMCGGMALQLAVLDVERLSFLFAFCNISTFFFCTYFILFGVSHPFGLYHVFYIFYLVFFGVVPPMEMAGSIVYWGGSPVIFENYGLASALGLVSIISFHFFYVAFFNVRTKKYKPVRTYFLGKIALVGLSVGASLIIYWYNNFSIQSVFVRGGDVASRVDFNQQIILIYQRFLYPIPSISFVCYLIFCKRNRLITFFLFILFIASNPATGMSRSLASALYTAVMLAYFPFLLSRRYFMTLFYLFGIFFIFPILNLFRYVGADGVRFEWNLDFLRAGHFDSFQSVSRVLDMDLTYGYQLLGSLLFFIPRSFWPDKPIGSGALSASESFLTLSNISMNFIGEGYINFGFFGSFLFILSLSFVCARIDKKYWVFRELMSPEQRITYLFAFGMIFFVLRGDFLSGFAYTAGLWVAIRMVVFVGRVSRY